MNIALTGHRPERLNLPEDVSDYRWCVIHQWIEKELSKYDTVDAYCGMASGCDMMFGFVAATMSNVNLHCILPCKDYNKDSKYFNLLKNKSCEFVELSDKFYRGCDNVRDQYLVDHADILLAIWDRNKSGGVWSTIRKAKKAKIEIIYIPKYRL